MGYRYVREPSPEYYHVNFAQAGDIDASVATPVVLRLHLRRRIAVLLQHGLRRSLPEPVSDPSDAGADAGADVLPDAHAHHAADQRADRSTNRRADGLADNTVIIADESSHAFADTPANVDPNASADT